MKLNYQQGVLVLPDAVLSALDQLGAGELRVLLWLSSDLTLAEKPRQLAKCADVTVKEAQAAIAALSRLGILCSEAVPTMAQVDDAEEKTEKTGKARPTPPERAAELPQYSSTEIADLMEKRESLRLLMTEAQQVLGKMFTPADVNIVIGMIDHLGMREESVLLLLAYCRKIEKKSLRYIEKIAIRLSDAGITEPEGMEEELRRMEEKHTLENEVRSVFGLKSRALTGKEEKMIGTWLSFGYGIDILTKAYEITVNATNEPSLPYANAILERWNAEGLRTPEDVDAYLAAEKAKREGKTPGEMTLGNSFETDEFFDAALRRSFAGSAKTDDAAN